MGLPTLPSTRFSSEDESEYLNMSISHLMSNLRTSFMSEDFDRVEEALVAREAKLKRENKKLKGENKKLKDENVVLVEKHQFDQLEKLKLEEEGNVANERYEKLLEEVKRGVECDDKDAVFELRKKNRELESENRELEALLERNYKELENKISQFEEENENLLNESRTGSRKIARRGTNGGMIVGSRNNNNSVTSSPVIDLENEVEFNGNGGMKINEGGSPLSDHSPSKENGKLQTSGSLLIIDSDDDCAPKVLKRKRASSLTSSDNGKKGDKFEQGITTTSEMKQHLKSSDSDDSSTSSSSSFDFEELQSMYNDVKSSA